MSTEIAARPCQQASLLLAARAADRARRRQTARRTWTDTSLLTQLRGALNPARPSAVARRWPSG
eukprot:12103863-Alexandrium_andersonii.AAC.1